MSGGRRRFRIIKEIAEGGFGKVYLAEQISSDGFSRIVAVKLLHAKWSSHDEVVMRTRDEARLLGLIRHQHIVKVEDLTSIDSKCAIVMEYLEGCDLKWMIQYLKEKGEQFPRAALFEIILGVVSALDAAYNGQPLQGGDPLRVIHRDIKPSNIFVTVAAGVKVLDFGTARANFAEREAKTQALAFGSQGYMAPERMLGEEDTPAADIFSLGVSLYELLTLENFGRIPPRPGKFNKKMDKRVEELPLRGRDAWCQLVRDTLRGMLSYEPGARPTAAELVDIFEQLAQDAGDMGMRRFCRTTASDAKEALPGLDTGDPLCGQIVDEDVGASTTVPGTPPMSSMPAGPAVQALLNPAGSGGASAARAGSGAHAAAVSAGGPASVSEEGGGSGGAIGLAIAGLGLVVVGGGVALMLAVGAAVYFGGAAVTDSPAPEPVAVEPAPAPAPAGVAGSEVMTEDSREDASRVPTTLRYSDASGGTVTILNRSGFKAEWDGKADFVLEAMAEGRYSTKIMKSDGSKVRGKGFSIDGSARSCTFTFDTVEGDWTGGCE
jgi:serine/threonine-protein kinase